MNLYVRVIAILLAPVCQNSLRSVNGMLFIPVGATVVNVRVFFRINYTKQHIRGQKQCSKVNTLFYTVTSQQSIHLGEGRIDNNTALVPNIFFRSHAFSATIKQARVCVKGTDTGI